MLAFALGEKYKRSAVKERAGLSRTAKGGVWDTGVVEHDSEFLIFTNVGTGGRTGHDYGNRWEGDRLRWYHKGGSNLSWESVQRLLEPRRRIHIFWRSSNDSAFEYAGLGFPVEVADTSPVEILWTVSSEILEIAASPIESPE